MSPLDSSDTRLVRSSANFSKAFKVLIVSTETAAQTISCPSSLNPAKKLLCTKKQEMQTKFLHSLYMEIFLVLDSMKQIDIRVRL